LFLLTTSEAVAETPSSYETEAFTAKNAEHAERRSRVEQLSD
jgi:hypothetical protein